MAPPTPQEIIVLAQGYGFVERRPQASKTLFLSSIIDAGGDFPTLINIFYTTRGVMTMLSHPTQGYNQMWRSSAYDTLQDLATILANPRVHTGKGYRNSDHAIRPCPFCGLEKKRTEYSKNQWRKGPEQNKCKQCVQERQEDQHGQLLPQTSRVDDHHPEELTLSDLSYYIQCDATGCGKMSPSLRCERCHMVYYCSERCQNDHSREHQPDCHSIEFMRSRKDSFPNNKMHLRGMAMAKQLSGNRSFGAFLDRAEHIHQEDGEWETAIELYKELLMRDQESGTPPQWRRVWMGLSRCFYELQVYDKAVVGATAAIEINRFFPQVYKYMALAQKASGDLEAAKATAAKALLYEAPWDDENRELNLNLWKDITCPGRTKVQGGHAVDAVLLYGVNEELWKACNGENEEWPCLFISLSAECPLRDLESALERPGLGCVVVENCELPHFERVVQYYKQEQGLVVFFAIEGVRLLPREISNLFGVQWEFSAYSRHEYVLSEVGQQVLGDSIVEQPYSKSNLLSVPSRDRILIPKPYWESPREYQNDEGDMGNATSDAYWDERYRDHLEEIGREVPMALHRAEHGGQVAYLGFINDCGHIPKFVRALCTRSKVCL